MKMPSNFFDCPDGIIEYQPEAFWQMVAEKMGLHPEADWQRIVGWHADLNGIDTHGLDLDFDEAGTLWIRHHMLTAWLEKRNYYCNRGRYGIVIWSHDPSKMGISDNQCFPRYFFSLQRLFDELHDWFTFNQLETR